MGGCCVLKQGKMTSASRPEYPVIRYQKGLENAGSFLTKERLDSLPLPLVINAIRKYPDTGESGDAYDAETFLEAEHW